MESLVKGPRAGRSVDGAFYDPSGYGNRGCRHPESTCPEPTRLLHVKLLSHGLQKAARPCASIKPWQPALSRGEAPRRHQADLAGPGRAAIRPGVTMTSMRWSGTAENKLDKEV